MPRNSRTRSLSNLNLQKTNTVSRYEASGMRVGELRFTRDIAGPFLKSLHSTLRRSVRVDSATKAVVHDSTIITLTAGSRTGSRADERPQHCTVPPRPTRL